MSDEYSDDAFWRKVKKHATSASKDVIEKALILYYALLSPDTPTWARTVIIGALSYFISPMDAIPDVIPAIGFTDDLTTIIAALGLVTISITPSVKAQAKRKMDDWFVV